MPKALRALLIGAATFAIIAIGGTFCVWAIGGFKSDADNHDLWLPIMLGGYLFVPAGIIVGIIAALVSLLFDDGK